MKLNIDEITKLLPHSYPFVFVDRVEEIELDKKIVGYKNVTINENFFQGHFPQNPVMPGVIIIEALAQISGILAMKSNATDTNNMFFLASISNVKFRKVVVPGDKLLLQSEVINKKKTMWKFSCQASVDNDIACNAEIMIAKG